MEPVNIQAQSIADDGTVAATTYHGPALWRPGADEWEYLHRDVIEPLLISQDGDCLIASESVAGNPLEPNLPLKWCEHSGWHPLTDLIFHTSLIYGASADLSHIVGNGYPQIGAIPFPWIWDAEHGQRKLPSTEAIRGAAPGGVSSDGDIVVGAATRFLDGSNFPTLVGIIWKNGQDPEVLHDDRGTDLGAAYLCARDCELIFGHGQGETAPEHPHLGEPWVRTKSGEVYYMGTLADAFWPYYAPTDLTTNGSLVVGEYATGAIGHGAGAFVWTQKTGMVSVGHLIDTVDIGDHDWRTMYAVSVTSTGDKILLAGWFQTGQFEAARNRAVILGLTPKDGVAGEFD